MTKRKVIAIVGPTATGKTSLAHCLAKELGTEIISADSRLVYQEMNIATAKPSQGLRQEINYHLIDVLSPSEERYSLGRYLNDATPALRKILNDEKIAIVVGGTGFYLKGLLDEIKLADVKPDIAFRESLKDIDTLNLYKQILQPRNISPNDRFRIIRALEIERTGARSMSIEKDFFIVHWFGLDFLERKHLRENIRSRTEEMLSTGLLDEAEYLFAKYGSLEIFKNTIGYKECLEFFEGSIQTKQHLLDRIVTATSQYAKRQLTWFRSNKKIHWLSAQNTPQQNSLQIRQML